jgi:hypothetical protein
MKEECTESVSYLRDREKRKKIKKKFGARQ